MAYINFYIRYKKSGKQKLYTNYNLNIEVILCFKSKFVNNYNNNYRNFRLFINRFCKILSVDIIVCIRCRLFIIKSGRIKYKKDKGVYRNYPISAFFINYAKDMADQHTWWVGIQAN